MQVTADGSPGTDNCTCQPWLTWMLHNQAEEALLLNLHNIMHKIWQGRLN